MATSTRSYPPPNSPTTHPSSSLQRKPTKKSSFLSLRREKKPVEPSSPTQSEHSHASFRVFDPQTSPAPFISYPIDPKIYHSRSASKSVGSAKEVKSQARSKEKHKQPRSPPPDHDSFDFPGDASADHVPWPTSDDGESLLDARRRAHSGSSRKQAWDHTPFLSRPLKYPFRDSGSSTLSQFEPLPQTPIDDYGFNQRVFSIPVVVAAPISGVETMDALVDGMNGSSEDDHYASGSLSSRTNFKKTGYHPLYHPPLPKPPPGITLGGAMPRKSRRESDSESDVENRKRSSKHSSRDRDKGHKSRSSRTASNTTVTRYPIFTMPTVSNASSRTSLSSSGDTTSHKGSHNDDLSSVREGSPPLAPSPSPPRPSAAPSILDIIKTHAPACQQAYTNTSVSRRASYCNSQGHSMHDESFDLPSQVPHPVRIDEELDLISRSSVDTIAEEVRQTIRNQNTSAVTHGPSRPYSVANRPLSSGTDYTRSPLLESRRDSSLFDYSTISDQITPPAMDISQLTKAPINSAPQMIAQYLRSSRLTTMLKLTRSPHASRDHPLTVSLSDLGSPTGVPLVVFLGLGCVRHIMGLYDEMAECMGIRLITIDRWGLGRTDSPRSKSARGIPEWATVIEEVLDSLQIERCSIMAHSAGAPYALSFASRFPERVKGDICLLAPWVGGGENSYKWLKYVPNGILKTAQAAEWKVQAWMIGKPPTIANQGIGFDVKASSPHIDSGQPQSPLSPTLSRREAPLSPTITAHDPEQRSLGSGGFSDYDDLRDFDGIFESKSTLGRRSSGSQRSRSMSENKGPHVAKRKPSKGFLGRLKGNGGQPSPNPQSPPADRTTQSIGPARRLKALRSMGSLKGRSSASSQAAKKNSTPPSAMSRLSQPEIPDMPDVENALDDLDWTATIRAQSSPAAQTSKSIKSDGLSSLDLSIDGPRTYPRSTGRRSISFGANVMRSPVHSPTPPPVPPLPSSPQPDPESPTTPTTPGSSYQAALGNALIAASHAESSKGTHTDLIQILNHDRQPWGFSYATYPHTVRVWYGDKDERIAENAVRWMEKTMGSDKCQVNVVKGADHALMFKSGVVIEVLEYVSASWGQD